MIDEIQLASGVPIYTRAVTKAVISSADSRSEEAPVQFDEVRSVHLDKDWSTPVMVGSLLGLWSILIAESLVRQGGFSWIAYPVLFILAMSAPTLFRWVESFWSRRGRRQDPKRLPMAVMGIGEAGQASLRPVAIDILLAVITAAFYLRPIRSQEAALVLTVLVVWRLRASSRRVHSPVGIVSNEDAELGHQEQGLLPADHDRS